MTTQEEPITLERVRGMSLQEKASLTAEQKLELRTQLVQKRMDKMKAADAAGGVEDNSRFCAATIEVLAYAIATMAIRFSTPELALVSMSGKAVDNLLARAGEIMTVLAEERERLVAKPQAAETAKGE